MVITLGYAADRDEVILVVDHEGLAKLVAQLTKIQSRAAPDHSHLATWTDDLTADHLDDAPVVHQLRIRLIGHEGGRDLNPRPGEWMGPVERPANTEGSRHLASLTDEG
jgi:hypothetical protein